MKFLNASNQAFYLRSFGIINEGGSNIYGSYVLATSREPGSGPLRGGSYGVLAICGTLLEGQGVEVRTPEVWGGASISTAKGLTIAAQKAAGVSTGFGIFQAGTEDLNYFYGRSFYFYSNTLPTPIKVWRHASAVGGNFAMIELYQEPQGPVSNLSIRFHNGGAYNLRLEAATDGFHFRTGDTAQNFYVPIAADHVNAICGFRMNGAAPAGQYLRGSGTNFVSSVIQDGDVPSTIVRTTRNVATTGGLIGGGSLAADLSLSIASAGVTLDKLQSLAASRLLGRGSAAGTGAPQEITIGSGLAMTGTSLHAPGAVPVGGVIAWLESMSGTPGLPVEFQKCDGSFVSDAQSPYNGQATPSLNGVSGGPKRFLRGSPSSGGTGGATDHSHSIAISTASICSTAGPTNVVTSVTTPTGNTTAIPLYYEVVYVMRIK